MELNLINQVYKDWISELDFLYNEELFLEELLDAHFIELCNFDLYNRSKEIVNSLKMKHEKLVELRYAIFTQQKYLYTLIESQNLKGEDNFKEKHKELLTEVSNYLVSVKHTKSDTFNLVKEILKRIKQNKSSRKKIKDI